MRLAVVASHPIQYHAPLFRELAKRLDLVVYYAHRATYLDQAAAGFGVGFDWDIDLLSGYEHVFLRNVAKDKSLSHFSGCDTPEIGSVLAKNHFDAILLQGWHLKCFFQGGFAAKRLRRPLLVRGDSHLQTPRSIIKKTVKMLSYPAFLRMFDAALYVGQRSRDYWRHYGYPPERLFFSPHCVDTKWFASRATNEARHRARDRLAISCNTKIVLFAGKLVAFKRPLDVVKAVSLITDRMDLEVMVAGSGALEADLVSAANGQGVKIHMLGFCNQSEMPEVYAAADVLVLPSDAHETWGLVANEALACGKPIILADSVGAASDLAADGRAGRVFPLGNVDALADTMHALMGDPPSPESVAEKSNAYTLSAAADGIEAAMKSCVKAR